ncbi:MAG: prolyl oligopeptidase family serine peptidase [Saprospiraceae bacterium]
MNTTYQTPPSEILNLINVPYSPLARLSPNRQWMLLLGRPSMPPIEEVAQEELRLAGLRINPQTNGASRSLYYNNITRKSITTGEEVIFKNQPHNPRYENFSWSPDSQQFAFTHSTEKNIELWIGNVVEAKVQKVTSAIINDAITGLPYRWFSDSKTLIYRSIIANRTERPRPTAIPAGPTIQVNEGGTAPLRTYQDLLKSKFDEQQFAYFTTGELHLYHTATKTKELFLPQGIYSSFSPSPDGKYILVVEMKHPFSHLVPYDRFPKTVNIFTPKGQRIKTLAEIPAAENIPKGFGAVRTGARNFSWRSDKPSALYWVEAQDGGDPKREVAYREKLFSLEPPFAQQAQAVLKLQKRYGGVVWGDDRMALIVEWQWQNRQIITSRWQPAAPAMGKTVWFDRSWEDRYNDPGTFKTHTNKNGRAVLTINKKEQCLYLMGTGASPQGNQPFVDKFFIKNQQTARIWQSAAPFYEFPITFIDSSNKQLLLRRESVEKPPNYFIKNLERDTLQQITTYPNPYQSLSGVQKQVVKYQRADGVELRGKLYLPADYQIGKDEPLPVLMWAYPREFKTKDAAGQMNNSPYEFFRLSWASPLPWVLRGYAIFDDFSMPIIGEEEEEPNETFIEQLQSGAQAAIDQLVKMGVADPQRIAVGGHSYGAFMTANLLAHTNLFAAGIARSGAYNRTLTPFGFQAEERTLWEAPEVYQKMSPFNYVDKIKTPLLLIHGNADNNAGTYPMQSERFFKALKGHGATTRLVLLPHESHGYRAKESVFHTLWEMDEWLEKYVKNKL